MISDPPFSKFARSANRTEPLQEAFCGFAGPEPTWSPSVNLYEAESAYRVCMDLAGVDKATIDVSVRSAEGDRPATLSVSGQRPVPRSPVASRPGGSRVKVHRMELDHGPFCREVELPRDVDQEAVSATYRSGLLWVELPKAS